MLYILYLQYVKPTQDREFPFPWNTTSTPAFGGVQRERVATSHLENETLPANSTLRNRPRSPKLEDLDSQCAAVGSISLNLCKNFSNASAGTILRHSIRVIEKLFTAEEPLIFKIGFSHNPVFRWQNDIYGYVKARERWSHMVIAHYSKEPFSAAMLEAALIEKYGSICVAIHLLKFCYLICFLKRCLSFIDLLNQSPI